MSQENSKTVRGVRYRISLPHERAGARRTLDERVYVRFPTLFEMLAGAATRLPPGSRLRRLVLVRFMQRALAAANRRDFDVLLLGFDPTIEFRPRGDWNLLDLGGTFHGHEGYREMWRKMIEGFEDLRLEPEEAFDLGEGFLVTVKAIGHGSSSGVPISLPLFQLVRLRRGLVVWQQDFADRAEALDTACLWEQ
jgi:hypothetical protein